SRFASSSLRSLSNSASRRASLSSTGACWTATPGGGTTTAAAAAPGAASGGGGMKNLFSSGLGGGLSKETPGCSLAVANDSSPAFWGFPPFLEEVFQTRTRTSATTAANTSVTVTFGL